MSGTAVLYVTRSGHCRDLAVDFGKRSGSNAHEIVDLVPRSGFIGFMKGGAQAMKKVSSPIVDPKVELSRADTIVLVHPVWASNVCPPIRSWLQAHKAEVAGKKLGLIVSNKGSEGGPVKAKFEEEFGPLAAFVAINEAVEPAERTRLLDGFQVALGV